MVEENLNQNQAAEAMQVSPSQILRWRVKSSALEQESRQNTLQLHKGPAVFLFTIEKQLINFVEEWRRKGIPVSCLSLIQKTC